jgi:hypothetical protein
MPARSELLGLWSLVNTHGCQMHGEVQERLHERQMDLFRVMAHEHVGQEGYGAEVLSFGFCSPIVGKIIQQCLWGELCDIKRMLQQLEDCRLFYRVLYA